MPKTITRIFGLIAVICLSSSCSHESKTKEQMLIESINLLEAARPVEAVVVLKKVLDKDPNYFEARLQLAKTYARLGDYTSAEKEIEKVRRQNPSSRDVKIETARIMAATKRPDEALRELAPYLAESGPDCDALQIAGSAHAVKKEYTVAVVLLSRAAGACASPSASLLLGGVYASSGRLPEAEDEIKKVLITEPNNRKALYLLAEIQISRKDAAAAFETLDRVLRIWPDDVEAKYRKGLLYLKKADYEKAVAIGQELTQKVPNRPEADRLLGFAFFFKKQYADALAPLQKSAASQPNAATYYILGLTHAARNESEQAINQLQKALDLQPSFTAARLQFARILLSKNRTDDAIREVKKSLAEDNDDAFAHDILGSAYLSKGEYAEGIAELNKALALDPALPDAHWKKGLAALKRGISQEVETELTAVIRTRPEVQNARRLLAVQYINNNQPAKAMEVLQKDNPGGPADAVTYYLMGEAYQGQNKENEAKTCYLKAKEADPLYDLAYQRLATIYFKQERQELAIQELRNLLDHSPNNVQALLILAALDEMNGNDNSARKTFLRAAETGRPEGILGAGYYFLRTNDVKSALKIVNVALDRSGINTDPAVYELKGKILFTEKKYRDALAAFEDLERRNPQLGFDSITGAYLAMGEPAKAIEKAQSEVKKNPTALNLRSDLSRLQLLSGKRQEAMETAKEAIRKWPGSSTGYRALALVHQNNREIDEAIAVLKRASGIQDVESAVMLSSLYLSQKKYSLALQQCEKVRNTKSEADLVLFQKAAVLQAMGRKKEAETAYEKLIQVSPNFGMALNNLAYLYMEENRNLSEALLCATRALLLMPGNDQVADTLGCVLLKKGRVEQGLRMLQKASQSSPNNPIFHYHLGIAFKESGQSTKAVESLQKALSLGDFPEAQDAAALLNKMIRGTKAS